MLTRLTLHNFRCFNDHSLPLRPVTVAVGRNNAGKSCLIEALRLVSVVVTRYPNLDFHEAPQWLQGPAHMRGVAPSLDGLEINFDTLFHQYGMPPAAVGVTFDNGAVVTIYLGPEHAVHAVITDPSGRTMLTKSQAIANPLPPVHILPQVAPLARRERVLSPRYVRGAMSSALAPLHFRNQLNLYYDLFPDFKELAESTWPILEIQNLVGHGGLTDAELHLMVRDDDFVVEVGSMGHGLQMWLQAMWFVARTSVDATVILDEPDVYLHADLQRKLIRLLRRRFRQVVVATHSIEMMSEAAPDEILIVDRRFRTSRFAQSLPAVRRVVNGISGVSNIELTRLWNARRCLFVEGKDIALLKRFQNVLFPESQEPIDAVPSIPVGGWSGWGTVETAAVLSNAAGERIVVYAIFDRDYHTPEQIGDRSTRARSRKVCLHIWRRKEIENYLLVPSAICRIIAVGLKVARAAPDSRAIEEQMERLIEEGKDVMLDGYAQEYLAQDRPGGLTMANRNARGLVQFAWQTMEGRLSMVPGKWLLSRLSDWSKREFGVSFGAMRIAEELTPSELHPEVVEVVTAIERTSTFPEP